MKKFLASIGVGGSSIHSKKKYHPEKGVPEMASTTAAPVLHRGNLRWEVGDFGSLLRLESTAADGRQPQVSITSAKLALPTEPRLTIDLTVYSKGFTEDEAKKRAADHLGLRLQVLSVPHERALISYRLLMLDAKGKILLRFREVSKEFKEMDALRYEMDKEQVKELLGVAKAGSNSKQLLAIDSKVVFVCEIVARTSFDEGWNFTAQDQPLDFDVACRTGKTQLFNDLCQLLLDSSTADIRLRFVFQGRGGKKGSKMVREFPVHRLLLQARAPKLMAELKENKEFTCSKGKVATLSAEEFSVEAMEELLRYLYTGAVSAKEALLDANLLKVALKYEIGDLVSLCEKAQAKSVEALVDPILNSKNNNTSNSADSDEE